VTNQPEKSPRLVYLPKVLDDHEAWEYSPQDWAPALVEAGKFGDGNVEFYVAEILGTVDVVIEKEGDVQVEIPEGTSFLVLVVEDEPWDQGNTVAELVERQRSSYDWEWPLAGYFVCWRHFKKTQTIRIAMPDAVAKAS